ncbi:adenylate/guanylate cyclase domain-containing protein [Bradyrhizobium cajani]|uniref:Tetratricopeptide repeat protein n=1 Tax=Bradyrhizobium cajani TaxID=1928661 RepID=A0A844TC31_9BRAD|nr:adenylate/guanylate cyclase domain-containing protein [Bradyrhizobium cajani]MCP3371524.1 adenylate/guanylate cyclase domain-containing protein [Bradyrhizobium cajani]MVT74059.1 tetratricopeptide repeat protein [Bradyrhizobium cajani]
MAQQRVERRLTAILAADVAGYSRLMGMDEAGTARRLRDHLAAIRPIVARHDGRIVKTTGDGVLIEFPSVVAAVECAIKVQKLMARRNAKLIAEQRVLYRIGINLGEVLVEGDDILGDGVNIAARLEGIAEPGGICLSRSAYEQVKSKIDTQYADMGEQRLKNIADPLQVFRINVGLAATASAPPTLPLPDRPSIVVLPFMNLSDDPEHAYFADGVTEDLTTALSRLRWLFVIARNSAFVYKDKAVDVRTIARDLGVRYALEGSVRTAGQRIRITGQLIDGETAKHIWAEKYDRQLHDIFTVQDEITENIVAAIEPHLYAQEGYRAARQPPESVDVWGLVVRAIDLINKFGRKHNEEAQRLLRRAIEIDPNYARAHATLSWAIWWATLYYYVEDRAEGYRQSALHAQKALRLDQSEPWAHMMVGLNLSTSGQHQRALAEHQAALNLNPSFALAHMAYGWALLRAGRFDDAIAETAKALRMSPLDSFSGLYTTIHGLALLAARRFAEALPYVRASVVADAEFAGHYNALISCCGHLGLIEEAAEFTARRNKVGPPLRVSVLRNNLRGFAHCEVFAEGLIKAGIPE